MNMAWEVKELGKIGNIFSGNSINAKTKKEKYLSVDSGLPYVATKDVSYDSTIDYDNGVKIPENEISNFRVAHKNSIFICAEGGSAGRKLAFNTEEVCFVNKLFALETFDFMEPRFVYYFYHTSDFQEQFKSQMTGLIGGVSMGKFKHLGIPVPPLPIQKRIVATLDEAFEKLSKAKENAEKNLINAKEVFESYLQSVFENNGEGWEEKKLGKVCEVIAGQSPEGKFYNKLGEGLPFYQGKKEFTEKFIGKPTTWTKKITKEAEANDVLMSVRAPVGPINFSTQKICIGRGLAAIRTGKQIDKEFLFNFLLNIQNELIGNDGAVFNSINKTQIENIKIPLPPIPEQKKILSKLNLISQETKKLESVYNQKLTDLEELKQSILQKAFNGELTGVSA